MPRLLRCPACGFVPLDDEVATTSCPRCGAIFVEEGGSNDETVDLASAKKPEVAATPVTRWIGSYEILEEVSRGAMGIIFKCRQAGLDRVVALKLLIAGEHASDSQIERFKREAQAAARLRHPNIVSIHEIDVFEGKHYFTMDFIEGENLGELIRQGKVPIHRALEICAQVADALHYAHQHNVIHRDIKPGNIIIDKDGQAHVTDFGLAKFLDTDTKFTKTGTALGTPAYMPPEQAGGRSSTIDHRADVYSLGAVLYEMLTGRPPFSGSTMMETIMKVLEKEPTPPRKINPKIHRDVQTIVLKAMEKVPDRRYPTAKAFGEDIRRFIAGEAITARPASIFYRGYRSLAKHKTAVVAVMITIAVALALANIASETLLPNPEEQKEQARRLVEAEETRRQMELQKIPQWKAVFEDDFVDPNLPSRWSLFKSGWEITSAGLVFKGDSGMILTKQPFTGNLKVDLDFTAPSSPEARLKCYLGPQPQTAYAFTVGRFGADRILLYRDEALAETRIPELRSDLTYHISITRDDDLLSLSLSDGTNERVLRYRDIRLLNTLPTMIFGMESWNSNLTIHKRLSVTKEFPPLAANPVLVVDGKLYAGSLDVAASEYEGLAKVYEGQEVAIEAKHKLGIVHEIRGGLSKAELAKAIPLYQEVEEKLKDANTPRLRELRVHNAFRLFSCLVATGEYARAVEAFRIAVSTFGGIDRGYFWRFRWVLSQLSNSRNFEEALQIIQVCAFDKACPSDPDKASLKAVADDVQLRSQEELDATVADIGNGLAETANPSLVVDLYKAYPTPRLHRSFERAAGRLLDRKELNRALELLAFAHGQKLDTEALAAQSVRAAKMLVEEKRYERLPEAYAAYPTPGQLPHFADAIKQVARGGDPARALELLTQATTNFPDKLTELMDAGQSVAAALVGTPNPADFKKVSDLFVKVATADGFKRFGEPCVVGIENCLKNQSYDQAFSLLSYAREYFPERTEQLTTIAIGMADSFIEANDYENLKNLYRAFPMETLAPEFAKAVRKAAGADLGIALDLFAYARAKHPDNESLVTVADLLKEKSLHSDAGPKLLEFYRSRLKEFELNPATSPRLVLEAADYLSLLGKSEEAISAYRLLLTAKAAAEERNCVIAAYRVASLLDRSGKTKADDIWKGLGASYPGIPFAASLTRLMTSPLTEDELKKWVENYFALAPAGDVEFLVACRARSLGYEGLAKTLLAEAAKKGGRTAWFAPYVEPST